MVKTMIMMMVGSNPNHLFNNFPAIDHLVTPLLIHSPDSFSDHYLLVFALLDIQSRIIGEVLFFRIRDYSHSPQKAPN